MLRATTLGAAVLLYGGTLARSQSLQMSGLVQCKPVLITWTDDAGSDSNQPTLLAIPRGNPTSIIPLGNDPTGGSIEWMVDYAAGTMVTFDFSDSSGGRSLASFKVENSDDSSCLASSESSTPSSAPSPDTTTSRTPDPTTPLHPDTTTSDTPSSSEAVPTQRSSSTHSSSSSSIHSLSTSGSTSPTAASQTDITSATSVSSKSLTSKSADTSRGTSTPTHRSTKSTDNSSPTSTFHTHARHSSHSGVIGGIVGGLVALVLAIICGIVVYRKRRRRLVAFPFVTSSATDGTQDRKGAMSDGAQLQVANKHSPITSPQELVSSEPAAYSSTTENTMQQSSSTALARSKLDDPSSRPALTHESLFEDVEHAGDDSGDAREANEGRAVESEGGDRVRGEIEQLRALVENLLHRRDVAEMGQEQLIYSQEGADTVYPPPPEYSRN